MMAGQIGLMSRCIRGHLLWTARSSLVAQCSHKHSCVTYHCSIRHIHIHQGEGLGTDIERSYRVNSGSTLCKHLSQHGFLSNAKPLLGSTTTGCFGQLEPHHHQVRHFSQESISKYFSSDFTPVGYAQQCLESIHTMSGMPWWATIVLTTVALRTVITLPCTIYSFYILAKVERLRPEIMDLSKELKGEVAVAVKKYDWSTSLARRQYNQNMRRIVRDLYIRDNCHPFKATLIIFVQIPLWISLSFALRNMAGALPMKGAANQVLCPELSKEGMLWFTDLLVADSTLILPITMAVLNLAIVEMNALRTADPTRMTKILTNVFRGFSLCMVPLAAVVPSCMSLYWTTSSLYGLVQNIMLRLPSVRSTLRVPLNPSESKTPFQDMYAVAKQKYGRRIRDSS